MDRMNNYCMTKDRILNEATTLFAQKGYRGVTVREITEAANCNLASVNYHFGNKWNLYLAVFRFRWLPGAKSLHNAVVKDLAKHDPPSPSEVVKALAHAFLEGPLAEEERTRHSLLMFRELTQPTEAFELIAKEAIIPLFQLLTDSLRPVMPAEIDEKRLKLNIFSIFAMVVYFNFARAAITRVTGQKYDQDFKAMLAEHITNFSLNGLGAKAEV